MADFDDIAKKTEKEIFSKIQIEQAENRLTDYSNIRELRKRLRSDNLNRTPLKITKNSSIKKVGSFLRKLKSLSDHLDSIDSLCEDASKLKLSKFLSEIISIFSDLNFSRKAELEALIKISSVLHREHSEFSLLLENSILDDVEDQFSKLSAAKESDAEEMLALFNKRQRRNLRLLTELFFTGVISSDSMLVDIIRSIIKRDKRKDKFFAIPTLLCNFLSYSAEECTGKRPRDISGDLEMLKIDQFESPDVLDPTSSIELKKTLNSFYNKCHQRLIEISQFKQKTEETFVDTLRSCGGISDKKIERLKQINEAFNRLFPLVASMSNSLDAEFDSQNISQVALEDNDDILQSLKKVISNDKKESFFRDEETRAFYEDFPDISIYIPKSGDLEEDEDPPEMAAADILMERLAQKEQTNKPLSKLAGFALMLEDLEKADSKAKIDEIAERFCLCNCRENRIELLEKILRVKKTRQGMIVYYSRLIATLSQYFKEFKVEIKELLEKQFYGLFLSKGKQKLTEKLINITFVAELTKFDIFPTFSLFRMLDKCLKEMSPQSIQVACSLMEICGRWLYKNPLTSEMCKKVLKTMQDKSNSSKLDESLKSCIKIACYQCNPPPIKRKQREKLSPEKAFIRHVIFELLNKSNVNQILKLLRKMEWNSPEISDFVRQSLMQLVSLSFDKLPLVASIVAALETFYGLGRLLVDDVLEEIRFGLENEFVFLVQRRIALVSFLGELYVYRLIDVQVVLDTLYLLITFNNGLAEDKSALHSGEEFRIKLVCVLLKICGRFFKKQWARIKLERFLLYFQRFIAITKFSQHLTAETVYNIETIFDSLFPNKKILDNLKEIESKIDQFDRLPPGQRHRDKLLLKNEVPKSAPKEAIFTEEPADLSDSDFITEERNNQKRKEALSQKSPSDAKSDYDEEYSDGESWQRKVKKSEEDILFEKEYVSLVQDSVDLMKLKNKSINIHDSTFYTRDGAIKEALRGRPHNKNAFCFLVRGKGDSKPIPKEISLGRGHTPFVIQREDENMKQREQKRLRENVLKMEQRIFLSEAQDNAEEKWD